MLLPSVAHAQLSAGQIAEEREAIAAGRVQAKADLAKKLEACRHVFLTTDCSNKANADARRIRTQFSEREAVIEQMERKDRAAARLDEIEQKQSAAQQRSRAAAAETRRTQAQGSNPEAAASAAASAASAAAVRSSERRRQSAQPCAGASCETASQRAILEADYARKQADAEEHRAAVLQRNAARDPAKAGKPLPVPGKPPAAASGASQSR